MLNFTHPKLLNFQLLGALTISAVSCNLLYAHGSHDLSNDDLSGPRGIIDLPWQAENVQRTFTAGYPDTFGIQSFLRRKLPKTYTVNGKQCIKTNFIALDIKDAFAFNIDETIEVNLSFDSSETDNVLVSFDANGKTDAIQKIEHQHQGKSGLFTQTLKLDRARFANRGMDGADFAIAAEGTYDLDHQDQLSTFGLCDVSFKRTGSSKTDHKNLATLTLNWQDKGEATAVRFGLYDQTGKAVLPSEDAIDIHYYENDRKLLSLQNYQPRSQPWPHSNRHFSYAKGQYRVQLPAGEYQLVATKGPEYRVINKTITVTEGDNNQHRIELERWDNLPAKGWHSGDVHIHMRRDKREHNDSIMAILQAEDVHVSNLLLMNNPGAGHYDQYAYGKKGQVIDKLHSIVPGIESPRTAQRGHTIALNIEQPIIDPENYFLYHRFMQQYQQQNAINGYAHVGSKEFNASWGLALDVPFGLIDFVEIMQNSDLRTGFWYEFMGLGYRLAPASGSDFPYFEQPGAVRGYAKTNQFNQPSTQQWFDAVKKGHTFVSNGPILEFTVNGKEMGSSLAISDSPLKIQAKAAINPDFDSMQYIELVSCGKVIERIETSAGNESLTLNVELDAKDSQWLAVRAYGKQYAMAHSAAVFVEDKNGFSGCKNQIDSLANTMLDRLELLATSPIKVYKELEYWETGELEKLYQRQLDQLKARIELAKEKYYQLFKAH